MAEPFRSFLCKSPQPMDRKLIRPTRTRRQARAGGAWQRVRKPAFSQVHTSLVVGHSLRGLRIECNDCIDAIQH